MARNGVTVDALSEGRLDLGVGTALQRTSGQLSERCAAIDRAPGEITRSVLLDFNPPPSPVSAGELAEVVRHLYEIGLEECIAYAWLDGVVSRSTDELLSFVLNILAAFQVDCS
jgi:hypothetical protein